MQLMPYSQEYADGIRTLYFRYVAAHPFEFLAYLGKGAYDYWLFLPYYTWAGRKSAQAYVPSLNPHVRIDDDDVAYGYKSIHPDWILNLRWKYLPSSVLFYVYFALSYAILAQACWTAATPLMRTVRGVSASDQSDTDRRATLFLQGMLIYFAGCSIVRIAVPVHGHGAMIAFNTIVMFNLIRLVYMDPSTGSPRRVLPAGASWKTLGWALPIAALALLGLHRLRVSIDEAGGVRAGVSRAIGSVLGYARDAKPHTVAYSMAPQTIHSAVFTAVGLDAEDVDTANMHNLIAHNSRITIPRGGDGFYAVSGYVTLAFNPNGQRIACIYRNGGAILAMRTSDPSVHANPFTIDVTWTGNLAAGDYLELVVFQDSGVDLTAGDADRRHQQVSLSVARIE
jgi:hypothetical protein